MFGTLGTSLSAYGAVGGVRLEVGGKKLSTDNEQDFNRRRPQIHADILSGRPRLNGLRIEPRYELPYGLGADGHRRFGLLTRKSELHCSF